MNPLMQQFQAWLGPNAKAIKALMAPLLMVMILAMMVLPLPAFVLDLLFTFNIALSLMVLLVAVYTVRPLDFAAFPTVLLLTTLLRLSLNVASTRVVLLDGHTGAGCGGQGDRGVRPLPDRRQLRGRPDRVRDPGGHQLHGRSPRAPAASPRSARASPSTRCPASRWRSTPT